MAPKAKKSLPAAPVLVAPEPAAAPVMAPKSLNSFAEFGRENVAAMTEANRAWSQGLQAIGQELLTYARSSFERTSRTATALLAAKTLDEVIQLNSDLAKANLEALVARSAKLSQLGVSVASETLAPLAKFGRIAA